MAVATALRAPATRIRLSPEEIEKRRQIVRDSDHENLLEGQSRHPETDHIFEAYIQGEIEVSEIGPRLTEFFRTQAR